MAEIKYEVVKEVGVLSETGNGWKKAINLISWNEREPVYDIRTWSDDMERMGKGVTLTIAEVKELKNILSSIELD